MLSRNQKISSAEFKEFFNKGKKSFSKNFRCQVLCGDNKQKPRYAVVISKKVAKSAVLRNKNKRKIYKILQQIYPQFSSLRYVFVYIQKDISCIENVELSLEIQNMIDRVYKK